MVDSLTEEELEAVTVVFHQYETGLREGTILTRVQRYTRSLSRGFSAIVKSLQTFVEALVVEIEMEAAPRLLNY